MKVQGSFNAARRAQGFTLVELMIALALGLIVSAAALTMFTTSRQTYRASESLGRVQENGRMAFEVMARDVREAAGNACGDIRDLSNANVLNDPAAAWYLAWSGGIRGYDGNVAFADAGFGTGLRDRAAGTDAIELKSSVSNGINIVPDLSPGSAEIKVSSTSHGLTTGDIVLACDPAHSAIFQVTAANASNVTIGHNAGGSVSPGNRCKGLGGDGSVLCPPPNGIAYSFGCAHGDGSLCSAGNQWPATIAKLKATRWYVGHNGRDGLSLYQARIVNSGGTNGAEINEIAEGVIDMQIDYLLDGATSYVPASSTWGADQMALITAIRLVLTLEGTDNVGTDGAPLRRALHHTVTIRNRTS